MTKGYSFTFDNETQVGAKKKSTELESTLNLPFRSRTCYITLKRNKF